MNQMEQLKIIIKETSTKGLINKLKWSYPELKQFIIDEATKLGYGDKPISEQLYILLNPTANKCKYGKDKSFVNFAVGYVNCSNNTKLCQCTADSKGDKISKTKLAKREAIGKVLPYEEAKIKILDLINTHDIKVIVNMVLNIPDLYSTVQAYVKLNSFNVDNDIEAIYCFVNKITPPICGNGNKQKFKTYKEGYGFCNVKGKCLCNDENQSIKMNEYHEGC